MLTNPITVRDIDDIKIIDITHDVSSRVAINLINIIDELIREGVSRIIVNFSDVKHVNSAAIGTVVGTAKQLRGANGDLKIYGISGTPKRNFDLVGASSVVDIYESESDAIAAFGEVQMSK